MVVCVKQMNSKTNEYMGVPSFRTSRMRRTTQTLFASDDCVRLSGRTVSLIEDKQEDDHARTLREVHSQVLQR
jgi:hypothetical protein